MSVPRWLPSWESSCHGNKRAAPTDAKGAGGQRVQRDMKFNHGGCALPSFPHLKRHGPSGAQVGRSLAAGLYGGRGQGAVETTPLQMRPVILGDLGDL